MEKHCIVLLMEEDAHIAKEALMKHRKYDWLIVLAIVAADPAGKTLEHIHSIYRLSELN